jgi:hypothetical protein
MTITEMLDKVQYVTNTEGTRQAVIVELAIWEELLELLEDLEDIEEIAWNKAAIAAGEEELIPWEQVEAEYLAAHPE